MDATSVSSVKFDVPDGAKIRIGIISTRRNAHIVDALKGGAKKTLLDIGVKDENIFETSVPGSWELPSAARFLALSGTVDAILCIGCLIKGDTLHFNYLAETVSSGLMTVQLSTNVPCTFGVLTCLDERQAAQRSYAGENHGISWAKTAVEMAALRQSALGIDKRGFLNFDCATTEANSLADNDNPRSPDVSTPKIYF